MNRSEKGFVVISRRIGQSITIGDDIEILITGKKGGMVRIGVTAPKSLEIKRSDYQASKNEETNFNKESNNV